MKNWQIIGALGVSGLLYAAFSLSTAISQSTSDQTTSNPNGPVDLQERQVASADPSPPKPQSVPPLTFGGYPCESNCLSDEAGYRWASSHGISDPEDCTGNTGTFIEGCRVYAMSRDTTSR
jgi:hypothetical protein